MERSQIWRVYVPAAIIAVLWGGIYFFALITGRETLARLAFIVLALGVPYSAIHSYVRSRNRDRSNGPSVD